MKPPPHPRPSRPARPAFTLVEMLVVIAIIAVLAALAFPAYSSMQKKTAMAKAVNNIKQIAAANTGYSAENNGEILGWGRYNNYTDDTYLMRNLNLYLNGANVTGSGDAALFSIGKGLEPFVDPLVPKSILNYTKHFPWTWSINSIFNRANGRFAQGSGAWSSGLAPRRMVEFDRPSRTIYATSGGFEFSMKTVPNTPPPTPLTKRAPIFYLYGNNDTTPAVFLDGHTELLRFQIPEHMVIPGSARE